MRRPSPENATRIKFATIDSTVALMFALFINGAILVVAAATFYHSGHNEVADIQEAYAFSPRCSGTGLASTLFAVALLASGQNSTLTGTMAGPDRDGRAFSICALPPFLRRLITRSIAIIPAVIVTALYGEDGTTKLLIFSRSC